MESRSPRLWCAITEPLGCPESWGPGGLAFPSAERHLLCPPSGCCQDGGSRGVWAQVSRRDGTSWGPRNSSSSPWKSWAAWAADDLTAPNSPAPQPAGTTPRAVTNSGPVADPQEARTGCRRPSARRGQERSGHRAAEDTPAV